MNSLRISGYGKCAENVLLHKKHKIVTQKKKLQKEFAKPTYVREKTFTNEKDEFQGCEIELRKRSIKDNKPVHLGVAILQHSKLLLLRFMYDLQKHLIPGSFRPVYCDTGPSYIILLIIHMSIIYNTNKRQYGFGSD